MAAEGVLNALQLEMSVALRLPGEFRERAIEAISGTFSRNGTVPANPAPTVYIVRHSSPLSARSKVVANAPPSRVGIEFYDPEAQLGGMVSFDFGPGAAGGRIMMLLDRQRVVLFTAEGRAERNSNQLSIGPLSLNAAPGGHLRFHGPAVIVDDGTAYLSVEHALASSRLDRTAGVDATLEFDGAAASFSDILVELDELFAAARTSTKSSAALSLMTPPHAAFGRIHGAIRLNNSRRTFDANFRLGASFTGLGPQKFITRRMVWSNLPQQKGYQAFEARELELDDDTEHRIARLSRNGRWSNCDLQEIRIDTALPMSAPETIAAIATGPDGTLLSLEGRPGTFVMLSRPGPEGTRLHTLMGFAEFRLGNLKGAGMYEFSRRVGPSTTGGEQED